MKMQFSDTQLQFMTTKLVSKNINDFHIECIEKQSEIDSYSRLALHLSALCRKKFHLKSAHKFIFMQLCSVQSSQVL